MCTFVDDEYDWHEIAMILASMMLTTNQFKEIDCAIVLYTNQSAIL